eukprot:575258-Lingulodinium_polyedra.AAC.1
MRATISDIQRDAPDHCQYFVPVAIPGSKMDFLDDLDVVCPTPPVHNPVDGGAVTKPAARHRSPAPTSGPSKKLKTQDGTSTSRAPPLLAEDDARLERNKGQGQNKP